jgi:hypothetical protein
MSDRQPWEKDPAESGKAWLGFRCYRDLKPEDRTVERAWAEYQKASRGLEPGREAGYVAGSFNRWAVKHGWADRAEQWDREKDRLNRQAETDAEREAIKAMKTRHIGQAIALQTVAANVLRARLEQEEKAIRAGAAPSMTYHAMIRAFVEGTKIERLARGEPETIIQQNAGPEGTAEPARTEDSWLLKVISDPDALRAARDLSIALQGGPVEGEPGSDGAPAQ